jgi:hypothetical protein
MCAWPWSSLGVTFQLCKFEATNSKIKTQVGPRELENGVGTSKAPALCVACAPARHTAGSVSLAGVKGNI